MPFPTLYTFQALVQTDSKENLFNALMPAVMYFLILWKESKIFATVDAASCLGKERHEQHHL